MHLHNEFAPDSVEAKDLRTLLHPSTNLKQHQEHGPVVHERADGVYLWDNKGKQYLEGMAGLWCTAIGLREQRTRCGCRGANAQNELFPIVCWAY